MRSGAKRGGRRAGTRRTAERRVEARRRCYVVEVGYGPNDHVGGARAFMTKRAAERYAQEWRRHGQTARVRSATVRVAWKGRAKA